MHEKDIGHRDLKEDNIGIRIRNSIDTGDYEFEICIFDYGLCCNVGNSQKQ